MSEDSKPGDATGYMEFTLPALVTDDEGDETLHYFVVDFWVTTEFRNRYFGYDGEEYPPANEDVCEDLGRHFFTNPSFYFSQGMVEDALVDEFGVTSAQGLNSFLDSHEVRSVH